MAELYKVTKNGKEIFEDLKLVGVAQNLKDTSVPTTPRVRVEFERENGTKISFILYKKEVKYLKKQLHK